MIEGHGDDLYRYGDKVRYNFSTNIVSGTDHSRLIGYLNGVMNKIGSYPEPAPYSLERKLAAKLDVPSCCVAVTNGATDAMYRIAHLYCRRKASVVAPTFREYQDACRSYGIEVTFADGISAVSDDADLVWVCSPNNPTGKIFDKDDIICLSRRMKRNGSYGKVDGTPEPLIVADQAYSDYAAYPEHKGKQLLTPREAVEAGNIVLLGSLTKRYAVPGLRIGYAVASEKVTAAIRGKGEPWAVNTLAVEAGKYLLDHDSDYRIDAVILHDEAMRIAAEFRRMGIECSDTDCNFLLCRLPRGTAAGLKECLVEKHGILIRDASNFEGLDVRFFRVAAQNREQNDLLIKAVREWLRQILIG